MTYDQYYTPNPASQPVRRKRRVWPWILAAVLLVCGGGSIIAAVAGGGEPTAKAKDAVVNAAPPAETHPDQASAKPTPKPAAVSFGAGDYDIGASFDLATNRIKPGTYTVGADTSGHCYWERVKNWEGGFESILSNGNVEGSAKAHVTAKKTDKGLHLGDGCVAAIKTGGK